MYNIYDYDGRVSSIKKLSLIIPKKKNCFSKIIWVKLTDFKSNNKNKPRISFTKLYNLLLKISSNNMLCTNDYCILRLLLLMFSY